jgi:HupE / UreJ protein
MKKIVLLITVCFVNTIAQAHTINYVLEKQSNETLFLKYVQLGFSHILPLGFDHVLFIMCLFFLSTHFKNILWQATIFTIAHSITLALVAYQYIVPIPSIIEPIIALSIVILAVENLFFNSLKSWRVALIFAFGIVHGMGFAGALTELGLPTYSFATALASFNIGVELGQVAILVTMHFILKYVSKNKLWYRKNILIPCNIAIACVALFWTIQRLME